jgi:Ran GTPase-activating protein (RanGAP) involved in mRNA processing and transport
MSEHKVNECCWAGLKVLRENGLIVLLQKEDGCEEDGEHKLCSSLPTTSMQFDAEGYVTLIDLGGRRLQRGLPCSPNVFGQFARLAALNVGGTDLPVKDTMEILELVAPHIESIYLGGNGLGIAGAHALGSWLPSAPKLTKLDVRYNDIGDVGMEAMCEGLKETKVEYLYAEGNQIGDQGAIALSELLKDENRASTLREVFLGANLIQSKGAAGVASSLHTNKVISKIYLEGNNIGLQGADAFANVLEELGGNTALKNLFVDNNNIGKEGSKRLANALNSATAIGG